MLEGVLIALGGPCGRAAMHPAAPILHGGRFTWRPLPRLRAAPGRVHEAPMRGLEPVFLRHPPPPLVTLPTMA